MKDTITNHPTALHRLLAEMEALSPEQIAAAEPTSKRERSEEEIGILPAPLQAMFTLLDIKANEHNALAERHRAMHEAATEEAPLDRAAHEQLHREISVLSDEFESLSTLFWRSVNEQFDVDPKGNGVGIRSGW